MSRLTLVRHGESEANAARRIGGDADADLTPRGEAQARSLRATLSDLAIDRRVSSDLRRAVRTAELGWPHPLPALETHAGLRERTIGDWEGRSLDALRADGRANTLLRWDGSPPGGESLHALARRVLQWFVDHDDGSRMLVVVHGGVVRVLVGLLDGVPTDRIGGLRIANVQVEQRSVEPSRWRRLLDE
ncbi:MAG: histidine phosphatase family protein, partial [Planctomycetota bacterium]